MKIWVLLGCLVLGLGAMPSFAEDSLVGHWFYYEKIFQGQPMPEPPEATLRLHFEFYADGTDRLYWWHEGEEDLCSRTGKYRLEKGELVDTVIAVDPDNHPSCGRDPDMQLGKTTRTPYSYVGGDLHLALPFGEDTLVYVWKRMDPNQDK